MSPYQQFIQALSDDEIGQLACGEASIGCNSEGYCLEKASIPPLKPEATIEQARGQLLDREPQVLARLYSNRPLCRVEFNYQAQALLEAHGAALFCRHAGQADNWALMIDDRGLIAVGPDDVRSRYGYFCEVDQPMNETQAAARVMNWLTSGEAYDDYQTKTVCRYCQ